MSFASVMWGQPECTKKCGNDRCWWRQRDVHGLSPWHYNAPKDDPGRIEHEARMAAITEKYGRSYFPKFEAGVGTNVINVYCHDFCERDKPIPESIVAKADAEVARLDKVYEELREEGCHADV